MEDKKKSLKSSELKKMAKNIIGNAKEKKLIKPISEAFRKTSASNEVHKGDTNYYIN